MTWEGWLCQDKEREHRWLAKEDEANMRPGKECSLFYKNGGGVGVGVDVGSHRCLSKVKVQTIGVYSPLFQSQHP